MAVRQYIGARYVPLYVGDWDNTRNYEPLSIVTDANGNSFTSLKDVPAGTPLNNRDYWVQTSSFSGAVDQLQRRMNAAEDNIDAAQTDITALQGGMSQALIDITALQGGLSQAQTVIANLENEIATLNDRSFLIVTDSYGYAFEPVTDVFTTQLCASLMRGGAKNAESVYIRGGSFTRSTSLFQTALMSYQGDRASITDIVVVGGYNDAVTEMTTDTPLERGIQSFMQTVETNFPNARVSVAFVGRAATPKPTTQRLSILRIISEYKRIFTYYGAKTLSNTEYILTNRALLMDDGVHPNNAGAAALAAYLHDAILNGSCDVHYTATPSMIPNSGISVSGTSMYQIIDNGILSVTMAGIATLDSAVDIGQSANYQIGTLTDDTLTSDTNLINFKGVSGETYIQLADNTVNYVDVNAFINNKILLVKPLHTAIIRQAKIIVYNASITMPSLIAG